MFKNLSKYRWVLPVSLFICAVIIFFAVFAAGCTVEEIQEPQVIGNHEINVPDDDGTSDDGAGNTGNGSGNTDDGANTENPDPSEGETEVSGLVIPLADITSSASYYGVTVNGTYMQVIVLEYNGTYRTAFNTCQVCYGSPKAYFLQSGNYLICQNCKNRFALSKVGITSGGCNPYPILEADRVQTEESIIIPDDYLVKCRKLFIGWGGAQV